MGIKDFALPSFGVFCATIASWFGGWNEAIATLCGFMLIDYLTGIVVALVFKNSPKTENGGLESRAGFKGLMRKFGTLIIVLIACRLDLVIGADYIKDCTTIAFIANEAISIVENLGLMGVPLPKVVKDAISILNKKGEHNE